jgi:hypothetical protein
VYALSLYGEQTVNQVLISFLTLNFSVSETVPKAMRKNSLATKGLSLSQAQSISNLCFQRAQDISSLISSLNNATKTIRIGNDTYIETVGKKIPGNIVDLLKEKALLHSTQAFLMENIKAKDELLNNKRLELFVNQSIVPSHPTLINAERLSSVNEEWGWEQLSVSEYNEYLEAEAYAAHIGQFIHKNSPLDHLRKELSTMKTLEWITIEDGRKTPLKVDIHHTPAELLQFHEELAALHRKYEQRVNYFKAKVKNLVTEENARIARVNSDEQSKANAENSTLLNQYEVAYNLYQQQNVKRGQDFEEQRQNAIKSIAALKIDVDPRFQPVVDIFLKQLED